MMRSRRAVAAMLFAFTLTLPTLALGSPEETISRLEARNSLANREAPTASIIEGSSVVEVASTTLPTRERMLSLKEFSDAFHHAKISYNENTGEVILSGTTASACMKHFSFSKGEASTEIEVRFRYQKLSDKEHCLNKENILCENEGCEGLRSRDDTKIKLGEKSGEIRIVYQDPYDQDSLSGDLIKSDGKVLKHISASEKAENEKKEKIAKNLKILQCSTCNKTEEDLAKKQDALQVLVELGEKTEKEAEKEREKISRQEMQMLVRELEKASFSKEDRSGDIEELKEKIAALTADGNEKQIKIAKEAFLRIAGKKLKDSSVHPLLATQNALEELDELENLDLTDQEFAELSQLKSNLQLREGCLSGSVHPVSCSQVFAQIAKERPSQNQAHGVNQASGSAAPSTILSNQRSAQAVAIPTQQDFLRQTNFGSFGVPSGSPQFTPYAAQPSYIQSNYGLLNSGFMAHSNPNQGQFMAR